MDEEYSRSLERFKAFLNTEPVVPILSRNLTFLLDENRVVDSVALNGGFGTSTQGRRVLVGGADFLMRDDFDRRHWTAALRVELAHEVQHDNSSDRLVLEELRRWYGGLLHDEYGLERRAGEVVGQLVLNALEDARVDNIVCGRFPGYLAMLRFTRYAWREYPDRAGAAVTGAGGELREYLHSLESLALTGLPLPDAGRRGAGLRAALEAARPFVDRASLAETAEECGGVCRELLETGREYAAGLLLKADALDALLDGLSPELQEYQFSAGDRREQKGDGTDAGVRARKKAAVGDMPGDEGEDKEAPGEKGDSGSPGAGDNSVRTGDESGSLTGQEAKPKSTAGNMGREDRGESDSGGRSSNHGRTGRGAGMENSRDAASELASLDGPESIREVLGAGYSERESPPLTEEETAAMLSAAAADLESETRHEKDSRVEAGKVSPLSRQDLGVLRSLYADVKFSEKAVEPLNTRLPPEYMEQAKRLHRRLDRILRERRVRTENQRSGALSQKALWKAEVNDRDIFRRKSPPTKCECVFYLLVDRSGSMGTGIGGGVSKLFAALLTAAVVEEALKGIAFTKVVAFDGGLGNVEHTIIKDFDQKEIGSRCCDALGQVSAGNGNKDGYSIRVAAMDLEKRREKRKILAVLSDGLPSAYVRESEAVGDVRAAVQDARRRGIIVIPIMYGPESGEESLEAYRLMYEKGIISASPENILTEFEKLLCRLIR